MRTPKYDDTAYEKKLKEMEREQQRLKKEVQTSVRKRVERIEKGEATEEDQTIMQRALDWLNENAPEETKGAADNGMA